MKYLAKIKKDLNKIVSPFEVGSDSDFGFYVAIGKMLKVITGIQNKEKEVKC